MNYLYIILILIAVVLLLEFGQRYLRQRRENFENFENPESKIYFEENAIAQFGDNTTSSAVNLRSPKQFGTFGTSGKRPSFIGLANPDSYQGQYMKCPGCELQFDCSNYPYEVDEKHGAVCTNCIEKKMYNEFNLPVFAKSIGSPRVCRDLLAKK
jgi:hypothetical protein